MKNLSCKKIGARVVPALASGLALALGAAVTGYAEDRYLSEEELYAFDDSESMNVYDPLEPLNRVTFQFNDYVILKLIDPVTGFYEKIVPESLDRGAENFFDNLNYPVRLAGNLLQGRFKAAGVETGRFAVNATSGLGGILSVADSIEGLERPPQEDIGQAFGSWGIAEGPYLILPFLGPSNFRDLGGRVADRAVQPLDEPFRAIGDSELSAALSGTELLVTGQRFVRQYRQMKENALAPYSSLRNAYTDRRRAMIEE
ncbi:MAG: VacJ family lipoprotein [Opitutales bacterium]